MTCGIYILEFEGTDKVYVGQSKNIEERLRGHLQLLERGKHTKKLQEAKDQFGMPKLKILLECTPDELNEAENEAIELYDSVNNGFNTLYYAEDTPTYMAVGEDRKNCKYTNEQIILTMKLICLNTMPLREIQNSTGVEYQTVRAIGTGVRFKWLLDKFPDEYNYMINLDKSMLKDKRPNAKYTKAQILEAIDMLIENKYTRKHITEVTGIQYQVLSALPFGHYSWVVKEYPEKFALISKIK